MEFEGKIFVVAGAGGFLGKAIVRDMLNAGATVVATDVHEAFQEQIPREVPAFADRLHCKLLDISDAAATADLLGHVHSTLGPVEGAVNTAYPRNKNYGRQFLDVTYEDFAENTSMHLGGYFIFTQQCFRYAQEKKLPFSLVNLSSIYGVIAPRFEVYAGTKMTMPVEYAAIKSGLIHLTKYVSAYAKGTRFRANCVSPGGLLAGQDPTFLEKYDAFCRSKGMLDPADILGAVRFLLSDASQYVVGQNLVVDDGFSL